MVSADGRLAYYFGQPLDDLSSPPAFYEVDLQTGRNQPVSLTLDLKPPVSLAFDRQTGDLYVGGVDGDAFQIVRVPAASGAPPQPLLTLPDAARIEVDRRGGLFVAVRSRPAELFTFPTRRVARSCAAASRDLADGERAEITDARPLAGRTLSGRLPFRRTRSHARCAGRETTLPAGGRRRRNASSRNRGRSPTMPP